MTQFDSYWTNAVRDKGEQKAAVHVSTDPVTGVVEFGVYTDDGHGNGNAILIVPLARLLQLMAELKANQP